MNNSLENNNALNEQMKIVNDVSNKYQQTSFKLAKKAHKFKYHDFVDNFSFSVFTGVFSGISAGCLAGLLKYELEMSDFREIYAWDYGIAFGIIACSIPIVSYLVGIELVQAQIKSLEKKESQLLKRKNEEKAKLEEMKKDLR